MNQCNKCKKNCDRIDNKKDPEYKYLCCNCSGSYIDSLCEECESSKKKIDIPLWWWIIILIIVIFILPLWLEIFLKYMEEHPQIPGID